MENKILVLATTYFPPDPRGALRMEQQSIPALTSWYNLLDYDEDILLYIADDGSSTEDLSKLITSSNWVRDFPVGWSIGQREGVGASLNRGIRYAKENSIECILYPVDDWKLMRKFDLTPWVELLQENEDIGAIRLGPPHPNLRGTIQMFSQGWTLRLDRYGYAASMRPTLFHQRFWEAYGLWPEHMNALETERIYTEHFNATPGPDILLALPDLWEPLQAVELSAMVPA